MGLGWWDGCHSLVARDGAIHLAGVRLLKWPEDIERCAPGEMRADPYHLASPDGGATWERPKHVDCGSNRYPPNRNPHVATWRRPQHVDGGRHDYVRKVYVSGSGYIFGYLLSDVHRGHTVSVFPRLFKA